MRWICILASLVPFSAIAIAQPKAATLGSPVAPVVRAAAPDDDPLMGRDVRPSNSRPAASLGRISGGNTVSGISLGPVEDTPEERYNWGQVAQPWRTAPRPKGGSYNSESFAGWFDRWGQPNDGGEGGNSSFQSDADFENFISPMTNPFLAEDPRKLTELRPILIYQTIPNSQYLYRGGNTQFFGLQARIGITQDLSVTINKVGLQLINPAGASRLDNESGITELWFGPKYTFYRDCEAGSIVAAGAIFQLPVGPSSIYQSTGTLGLAPYITGAQKFGRSSFGRFTALDTFGYDFALGSARSSFLYNTIHLDYDVANWGRIFPLMELNWFYYTSNGQARPDLGFEFRDLGNVDAPVSGRSFFTFALGSRFKASPNTEFGFAGEFPLNGTRDLLDFRFVMDFIWRF